MGGKLSHGIFRDASWKNLRKRCMKGLGRELAPESVEHAEDIVFKTAGECFGEDTMKLLHIPEKMKRIVPTETVRLEARRMYEDFNIELENGWWIHFEFESDHISQRDLMRFREYEATTSNVFQKVIVTYVICTADAKTIISNYRAGINTYKVRIVRLNRRSADRLFRKLEKNSGEGVSRKELLEVVFSPLMKGKMSIKERVRKGFSFLEQENETVSHEDRRKMQAMLYLLATKFLTREELDEVKEAIGMTYLGQLLVNDGIQQGIQQGQEKGECLFAALAGKLLGDGRTKELERAVTDKEVRRQLYREYRLIEE